MKKIILQSRLAMKEEELQKLSTKMKKQWNEGFMVVPSVFKVQLVDEDWIPVEKMTPPKGQTVLIWIEYEDEGKTCQTYAFGSYDDGWTVYLQDASYVYAWAVLPEPYVINDAK